MEFMHNGSLYDVLQNETVILEGDIVHPILRDVAQGMRFLHAANPPIVYVPPTIAPMPSFFVETSSLLV